MHGFKIISKINIVYVLFIVLALQTRICAQNTHAIRNGVYIPASDTLRALVIFAEIDFKQGPCPQNKEENMPGEWGKDYKGNTLMPSNAGSYLDPEVPFDKDFKGVITRFYYESSFGKYVILGDYLPDVVSIPCYRAAPGDLHANLVFEVLDSMYKDTTLYTKNGYHLKQFDNWTTGQWGTPKLKKPDGYIDLVYIIWRNNRFLSGYNTGDNSGFGINLTKTRALKNMKGTQLVTSYNNSGIGNGGYHICIAEHLHGIFGGNNWHSGGGRGVHTFIATPFNYGATAQLMATMLTVCGWDRWMMDWKNPEKKFLISCLDENKKEVDTETLTFENLPDGGTFYLRDHVKTGDAIRIKLPYIDWKKEGDIKNQYLWIEYRSLTTRFDKYYVEPCCDNGNGKFPQGTPGMYCYLQVGKDIKEGDVNITTSRHSHPNGLGSWLLPVTAEGNFDFAYRYDKIDKGNWGCGSWGNATLPVDGNSSLPNPFTGYSDVFFFEDSNKDGILYHGDDYQPGLSDMIGDSVWFNYHEAGDYEDAFSLQTGMSKLGIATNPAPVPVYTHASDYEFGKFYFQKGAKGSTYENRCIHLNGLSIELIEEKVQVNGDDAIRVKIRWDDYLVNKNVRWCGHVLLHPHVKDSTQASLMLDEKKTMWIDRGKTPTQIHAYPTRDSTELWLSDTTVFEALPGSVIELKPRSKIILDHGSRFILKAGSTMYMGKKSRIIVKKGSSFTREEGAGLNKHTSAKIIYK